MQGKARFGKTLVATVLAVALVAMGVPLAAVGLGEDTDILNGTLEVAIAEPAEGAAFSRLDDIQFRDGTVDTLCPVVSRTWDFGDQTAFDSTDAPTHRYDTLGTKEATLLVVGGCGRVGTASVILEIVNLAPVAALTLAPASVAPGQALTLSGAGSTDPDGEVASYQFVIDGATQPLQGSPSLSHAFTTAGPHVLGLRVVDDDNKPSSLVQATLEVAPGALQTMTLAPDLATIVAGGSQAFSATGADQYGNPVAVAPAWTSTCGSIDAQGFFAAPTGTGGCLVSASASAGETVLTVSDEFQVIAAPLASIAIAGPDSLVAGTTADYALSGADQFGNPVALAESTLTFLAPTAAGPENLCYSEQDVSACKAIEVLPDALVAITVSGPGEVVAGQTESFAVSGFDQYGNAVALSAASFDWTAPTVAGPDNACWTEQGIQGCAQVSVIPDALASIAITGPGVVEAGQGATYALSGADQFGNPVSLAQSSLDWTAPFAAGPAQVCYEETGISACQDVEVLAGPVSTIAVSGPSEVIAGQSAAFSLSATDQYGNPVSLAQSSLDWTAPTLAGSDQVCYTEGDATGCAAVSIVPDALSSILVTGPSEMVAGTTAAFGVAGFDQYGNAVALAASSFDYTAPPLVGAVQACYQEQGLAGCQGVEVIADALSLITVTGPGSVSAGSVADFDLDGFDQHGNVVPLAQSTLSWTAPATLGSTQVCYSEAGIEGCAPVEVTPAALAVITVTGPGQLVVGQSGAYDLAGFDGFGNPVALAQASLAFDAPTAVGTYQACYQEQGILGCASVEAIAGPLDAIVISGPDTLVAGSSAAYDLAGTDVYGNAVALAQDSLAYTAPTAAGSDLVCYAESGISACHPVTIVPDALASIVVSGPASMVVGSTATFDLSGFDPYGNAVPLAQSTLDWTAPQAAGPGSVCHVEAGIQGCAGLVYVADTLNNIAVDGPGSVVAGQPAQYSLGGFDQYGNAVPLAQSTLDWTAPAQAGPQQVCYAEAGIEGCRSVEVTPDALFTIDVSGPAELVVGESADYAISGADQFGNAVALDASSVAYTAPTAPGSGSVCYAEDGVSGCTVVSIVHGPLRSIVLDGPGSVVAGQAADYALGGFDQYGNAVPLAQSSLSWTAPTGAGSAEACYEELGIRGCKAVEVLPDALSSIAVSGPGSVAAGSIATYGIAGFDQYENPVALAASTFDWTAPTAAGPAQACYEESGITGCADVSVVHGPLASIGVTGPATMPAGSTADFGLAGFDAFANPVPLQASTFAFTAPGAVGPAQACYEEQGVQGCADLTVVAGPLARLVVSPGDARTNVNQGKDIQFSAAGEDAFGNAVPTGAVTWSTDKGLISGSGVYKAITAGTATVTATSGAASGSAPVEVLNTLAMDIATNFDSYPMGSPVRGYAKVLFADGDPVYKAKVTLTFVGLSPTGMMCGGTFEGQTNIYGMLTFQAPPNCSRFLGDYRIDGSTIWNANRGAASEVYGVTL